MSYGYPQPPAYPQPPVYPQPGYPPQYGYGQPGRTTAPISVHIIAILQYLGGLVLLAVAVLFGLAGTASNRMVTQLDLAPNARDMVTRASFVGAAIVGTIALLVFIVARKLQRGRQWARILVLFFATIDLLGAVYTVVGRGQHGGVGYGAIVGPLLVIILLNTGAARSWFRYHTY